MIRGLLCWYNESLKYCLPSTQDTLLSAFSGNGVTINHMLTDTSCVWEWGEIHTITKYLLFAVQVYGRRLKYVLLIKYSYRNTAHNNWNCLVFWRKKRDLVSHHKRHKTFTEHSVILIQYHNTPTWSRHVFNYNNGNIMCLIITLDNIHVLRYCSIQMIPRIPALCFVYRRVSYINSHDVRGNNNNTFVIFALHGLYYSRLYHIR